MRPGYDAAGVGKLELAEKVLKTDPWSADLTYNITAQYYFRKDLEKAKEYATRFTQIAPYSKYIMRTQ